MVHVLFFSWYFSVSVVDLMSVQPDEKGLVFLARLKLVLTPGLTFNAEANEGRLVWWDQCWNEMVK